MDLPSPPRPLGDLAVLPREMRDQIYGHIIARRYCAFYSDTISKPSDNEHPPAAGCTRVDDGMAILSTSKMIYFEVSDILYRTARFCFRQTPGKLQACPSSPNTKLTERIMNIALHVPAHTDLYIWAAHFLSYSPGPLTLFNGSRTPRKSAIIQMVAPEWALIDSESVSSPFFDAIKCLVGFESVMLEVVHGEKDEILKRPTPNKYQINRAKLQFYFAAAAQQVLTDARDYLEPSLGPSSAMRQWSALTPECSVHGLCCYIEFHPRDYLAKFSKENEDTVGVGVFGDQSSK